MNKHQVKGRLEDAAREVQEQAGTAEKTAGDLKKVLWESAKH